MGGLWHCFDHIKVTKIAALLTSWLLKTLSRASSSVVDGYNGAMYPAAMPGRKNCWCQCTPKCKMLPPMSSHNKTDIKPSIHIYPLVQHQHSQFSTLLIRRTPPQSAETAETAEHATVSVGWCSVGCTQRRPHGKNLFGGNLHHPVPNSTIYHGNCMKHLYIIGDGLIVSLPHFRK